MNTSSFFRNSRIAVTGGPGTIGKQLVRQLLQYNDVSLPGLIHRVSGECKGKGK